MKVGHILPVHRLKITASPMRTMALILRDPNPIHLDPAASAAAGLGDRVINQGPSNVAYVMDMLMAAFPGHRLQAFECRFLSSVRDGDDVEAGGVVTEVSDDRTFCEAWLKVGEGAVALLALATLVRREAGQPGASAQRRRALH